MYVPLWNIYDMLVTRARICIYVNGRKVFSHWVRPCSTIDRKRTQDVFPVSSLIMPLLYVHLALFYIESNICFANLHVKPLCLIVYIWIVYTCILTLILWFAAIPMSDVSMVTVIMCHDMTWYQINPTHDMISWQKVCGFITGILYLCTHGTNIANFDVIDFSFISIFIQQSADVVIRVHGVINIGYLHERRNIGINSNLTKMGAASQIYVVSFFYSVKFAFWLIMRFL